MFGRRGLNGGMRNFPVQPSTAVQAAQRSILVEFVPTGSGLNLPTGGRVGIPMWYDYNDTDATFIGRARQAALNGEFGIQPGMTTTTLITMYAVWNQGHESVSSHVGNLVEFQRCGLLMERRNCSDRFKLVYVGHYVNGNGNGNVAGTGNSWL